MTPLEIQSDRLQQELSMLAGFSSAEAPAVTRVVFSEEDRSARAWLKSLFAEAGLEVREDAVGNTFARWVGAEPDLPAVATGSHADAIPNAGMYDGTVGVLGGLEAIRALQRSGLRPRRSIELILFTSEEPTRFGIGCLGSRLMSGALPPDAAEVLRDSEDRWLDDLRIDAGFSGDLAGTRLPRGHYDGFIELHIEQGPLLEREGLSIGLVEGIAAPAGLTIQVDGEGGHAGAVLMQARRDALTGAAEIMLAAESLARSSGSPDTVATVGVCRVFPGAVNSVPSRVQLEVDVRDTDEHRRDRVVQGILRSGAGVAARRGLTVTHQMVNADPPARSDSAIMEAMTDVCRDLGVSFRTMVSRAYHDSLFMARIAPVAMIFIPCRGGVSHRPDEYAAPQDIARGVEVLALTLAALAENA